MCRIRRRRRRHRSTCHSVFCPRTDAGAALRAARSARPRLPCLPFLPVHVLLLSEGLSSAADLLAASPAGPRAACHPSGLLSPQRESWLWLFPVGAVPLDSQWGSVLRNPSWVETGRELLSAAHLPNTGTEPGPRQGAAEHEIRRRGGAARRPRAGPARSWPEPSSRGLAPLVTCGKDPDASPSPLDAARISRSHHLRGEGSCVRARLC